jgi:hypothetical protein
MWHVCATVHCLPLESWLGHALQNDGDLSDVCEGEERVPNMSSRPRVRPANAGARYCSGNKYRCAHERRQQGVFRPKYGRKGVIRLAVLAPSECTLTSVHISWKGINLVWTRAKLHPLAKKCSNNSHAPTLITNVIAQKCAHSL